MQSSSCFTTNGSECCAQIRHFIINGRVLEWKTDRKSLASRKSNTSKLSSRGMARCCFFQNHFVFSSKSTHLSWRARVRTFRGVGWRVTTARLSTSYLTTKRDTPAPPPHGCLRRRACSAAPPPRALFTKSRKTTKVRE